ncbi:MAG: NAD(P)/FAD-dependent oxidoreductase [Rhodobacteraceae bacterium]|nr:NAD(P)/FAD-dependent oxidoreductase [Paracoccaceae bacterium]
MSDLSFDAVVIGGGHNGLVAAGTLARAGKSVCVIEQSDHLGGMASSVDLGDGVVGPLMAHLVFNMDDKIAKELGLRDSLQSDPLPSISLAPDGWHVVMEGRVARFANGRPHPDANAYRDLHDRLLRYAALLSQLADRSPPQFSGGLSDLSTLRELAAMAKLGIDMKRLGKADLREFLRVILSNAYDLVLDEMSDGPLAGAICADAVRGNFVGPRSPGTVFTLMYRMGAGGVPRLPKGGMGQLSQALGRAAEAAGAKIITGTGVSDIEVKDDVITGVTLSDGRQIATRAVLSSTGPMCTAQLAGVENFDVEAVRRLRNMRAKGTVAKLNLVLRDVPRIDGLDDRLMAGRLLVAPSAEAVEQSFNPAKYGEIGPRPVLEAVIPTLSEPDQSGAHVMSITIQHVPHTPDGGWDMVGRERVIASAVDQLEMHMPDLGSQITQAHLLTPADIEAATGAPGGHWHHAEMGIDQILNLRPINGAGRYAFAVPGLYLCGAGAHPGGDVTGRPGRNSAKQLLQDGVI